MNCTFIELDALRPADLRWADGLGDVAADELRRHPPARRWSLLVDGRATARASLWLPPRRGPNGESLAFVGHLAAIDAPACTAILGHAAGCAAASGAQLVVAPIDGSTWASYRVNLDIDAAPPFLMEPVNPPWWPQAFEAAGFEAIATYQSLVASPLRSEASAAPGSRVDGVRITVLDDATLDAGLRRAHALSLRAFRDNLLYTPLDQASFLGQFAAIRHLVDPSLVFVATPADAEAAGDLCGFMFALPDRPERDVPRTAILKTLAVAPAWRGVGLGGALLETAVQAAAAAGFERAIFALAHDDNVSRRMSERFATSFRRYALYGWRSGR